MVRGQLWHEKNWFDLGLGVGAKPGAHTGGASIVSMQTMLQVCLPCQYAYAEQTV
jgi:hypothetical protein